MIIIPPADAIRKKTNNFINQNVKSFDFSSLFKYIAEQIDACYKYTNDVAIPFVKLSVLLDIDQKAFKMNEYYIIKKIENCLISLGYECKTSGLYYQPYDDHRILTISW